MEGMSDSLLTFLQHLREFGLVFQRKASGQMEGRVGLCLTSLNLRSCSLSVSSRRRLCPQDLILDSPGEGSPSSSIHPSVFSPQRKSRRYYPTRLAITLATGVTSNSLHTPAAGPGPGTGPGPGSADAGFIVVETNYRIYAYTSRSEPPANEDGGMEGKMIEGC